MTNVMEITATEIYRSQKVKVINSQVVECLRGLAIVGQTRNLNKIELYTIATSMIREQTANLPSIIGRDLMNLIIIKRKEDVTQAIKFINPLANPWKYIWNLSWPASHNIFRGVIENVPRGTWIKYARILNPFCWLRILNILINGITTLLEAFFRVAASLCMGLWRQGISGKGNLIGNNPSKKLRAFFMLLGFIPWLLGQIPLFLANALCHLRNFLDGFLNLIPSFLTLMAYMFGLDRESYWKTVPAVRICFWSMIRNILPLLIDIAVFTALFIPGSQIFALIFHTCGAQIAHLIISFVNQFGMYFGNFVFPLHNFIVSLSSKILATFWSLSFNPIFLAFNYIFANTLTLITVTIIANLSNAVIETGKTLFNKFYLGNKDLPLVPFVKHYFYAPNSILWDAFNYARRKIGTYFCKCISPRQGEESYDDLDSPSNNSYRKIFGIRPHPRTHQRQRHTPEKNFDDIPVIPKIDSFTFSDNPVSPRLFQYEASPPQSDIDKEPSDIEIFQPGLDR